MGLSHGHVFLRLTIHQVVTRWHDPFRCVHATIWPVHQVVTRWHSACVWYPRNCGRYAT